MCTGIATRTLAASIAANAAASQVLIPALATLAQDAQHGLLVAAAMARTFLARGSELPLRRRRRKLAPKPAAASAVAATPAAAAAAPSTATLVAPATATTVAPAAGAGAASGVVTTRGLQQFLAGGVAGAISKTLVAPLERISTMLMADGRSRFSVGQAAAHAWQDGLYRGHAATLVKIVPASAIQFAVFNGLKDRMLAARQRAQQQQQLLQQQQEAAPHRQGSSSSAAAAAAATPLELENHERLLAGAAAGAAAACACYPLESLRTAMSGEWVSPAVAACRSITLQPACLLGCFSASTHGCISQHWQCSELRPGVQLGARVGCTLAQPVDPTGMRSLQSWVACAAACRRWRAPWWRRTAWALCTGASGPRCLATSLATAWVSPAMWPTSGAWLRQSCA